MRQTSFEEILVGHASPVLAKLKPSALLSFSRDDYPQLPLLAQRYSAAFRQQGLVFEIVCRCKRHFLLLVYRPILLERRLDEPEVSHCLSRFGYPASGFPAKMKHLRRRLRESRSFPHEIGLFLGYPTRDVLAFLGELPGTCKLCGYWKVYFDEEEARRIFARYDRCRDTYCAAYRMGQSVSQLLELPLPAA